MNMVTKLPVLQHLAKIFGEEGNAMGKRDWIVLLGFICILVTTAFSTVAMAAADEGLLAAINAGNAEKVVQLLDSGASVEGPDNNGMPLATAITRGNLPLVKLLVERSARLDQTAQSGIPPLGLAVVWEKEDIVNYLIGFKLNQENLGYALAAYAEMGKTAQVERLLRMGAPADGASHEGSALGNASRAGKLAIVKMLIAHGAPVNAVYRGSGLLGLRSALIEAVAYPEIVALLIQNGADVNFCTDERSRPAKTTVLMAAAAKGYIETAKLLVAAGADISVQNPKGDTAVAIAQKNGFGELATWLAR